MKVSRITTQNNKRKMIQAMIASDYSVSKACKIAGIYASTHYRWLKKDEKYVTDSKLASEREKKKGRIDCIKYDLLNFLKVVMNVLIISGNFKTATIHKRTFKNHYKPTKVLKNEEIYCLLQSIHSKARKFWTWIRCPEKNGQKLSQR